MSNIDVSDLDRALFQQARIYQKLRQSDEARSIAGWGQFIDSNPSRFQIGTYGTSSGTVITAKVMSEESVLGDSRNFLLGLWRTEEETKGGAGRRFSQNLKVFIFFLAVSELKDEASKKLRETVLSEIANRRLADGLWGDWWIDQEDHDTVTKIFPSAIALICLQLAGGFEHRDMLKAANRLSSLIAFSEDVPKPFLRIAVAAIAIIQGGKIKPDDYSTLKELVWSDIGDVRSESLYLYEYKFIDNLGVKNWKTEIFTFTDTIMLALAALRFPSETVFSIFCYNTADTLTNTVIRHEGLLPSDAEMRTHTLPQMWCCIYLSEYRDRINTPTFMQMFMFNLFAPKSRSTFWYKIFPVILIFFLAVANVILPDEAIGWRIVVSISTIMFAGLLGPDLVRRWLPGGR